ncbi:MAG: GNAT family N-acetyltransferase [Nocardioides sp.]
MSDDSGPELTWVREQTPVRDADKARIIGGAPHGAFVLTFADDEELPGDWWSARDADGTVLGYGRLDTTWGGDAEILLAVAPDQQGAGVGTFILGELDREAADRGLNYIHNRIRDHEQRDLDHDWLGVRGFRGPVEGDLRKRVGTTYGTPSTQPRHAPDPYDASQDPSGQPPGHEEQGGYVDVEEHQY